jgi:CheY-specific phosphatase CheX
MPDGNWSESLTASVERVLETMFFTFPCGPLDTSALGDLDWVGAHLEFSGSAGGELAIMLGPAAARSLAADFLGVEADSIGPEKVAEVVCELANMVCGSMVSELESQDLIHLSSAVCFSGPAPARPGGTTAEYAAELADGPLFASVKIEESEARGV